jgi:hypothetical protein
MGGAAGGFVRLAQPLPEQRVKIKCVDFVAQVVPVSTAVSEIAAECGIVGRERASAPRSKNGALPLRSGIATIE